MKRWRRRFLYLVVVVVWLIVMSMPILAFALASKGALQLGANVRLFLVQEAAAEGVGVEWKRPLRQHPACARTTIAYFMWAGRGDNVSYCQCADKQTGAALPAAAQSCNLP